MTAIIHDTRPTRNAIIALLQTKCEARKTARPNISIPQSVKTTAMPSKDGEPPGYEEDIEESEQNSDPATETDMDGLGVSSDDWSVVHAKTWRASSLRMVGATTTTLRAASVSYTAVGASAQGTKASPSRSRPRR
jgi:hypothetical protein